MIPRVMWNSKTVSVVLATYKEKASIRRMIMDFYSTGIVDEVIVVNNNAEPGTEEEVRQTPARQVYETRQGYGHAFRRGMREASGDYVITCEPDHSFAASDLERFLAYAKDFPVVLGSRTNRNTLEEGADMGSVRRAGNVAYAKMIELLYRSKTITDIGCSYKLFQRDVLRRMEPYFRTTNPLFATEIILVLIRLGIPFIEIPVTYRKRVGTSTIISAWHKWLTWGVRVFAFIWVFRFRPFPCRMTVNTRCRACEGTNLKRFLDLGAQPLANRFIAPDRIHDPEPLYPLEAYVCLDCQFAQLIHVVDKEELFRTYVYFSSAMPRVSPHWQAYAEDVINRFLRPEDVVVEIGSNDGILLSFFKERGCRVLGIDPAENIAARAITSGVPTRTAFFSERVAREIANDIGSAHAILANNVFAHINDLQDVCRGVKRLLAPRGAFVIEAPYLVDMFENLAYDTIYHEHLSFLSVRPLQGLFARHGLELFDVNIVPSQGQSLRLFVGHAGAHPVTSRVKDCVDREMALGMQSFQAYERLAERVHESKRRLLTVLKAWKANGKRIAGYGAPAKGNTLLNFCGIGPDMLDFVLEDMSSKHGLLTPGMHIPVVTRAYAEEHPPDAYLLLAWNYANVILDKERAFLDRGGTFIHPLTPETHV